MMPVRKQPTNVIRVQTNNPRKISKLKELGIEVTGRIPCLVKPGEFSSGYLKAKGRRMDHMDLSGSVDGKDGECGWDSADERAKECIPVPVKPIDEQTF